MIKYNNSNINDWDYGSDNIVKVYRNNAVVYYKITIPQYTEYEYIESQSGTTQWCYTFNTNFYPTTANTIEAKITMVNNSIDWGVMIGWSQNVTTDDTSFRFSTVTSGYQAIVRLGTSNSVTYRPTIGANNPTVYTLPLSATSGTYSINGGATQTINYNTATFSLPSLAPMHLFGDSTTQKAAVCRIHYVKVYDGNGNLVKHYVPSDNNGTPCFYEIVNGEYIMNTYTGSNAGTLTLGPAI